MLKQLLAPQFVGLYILAACTRTCHFRGRERLRIGRQLGDHSTFLAPYNVLMYAGSAVPNEPVISVDHFPELASFRTIGRRSVTKRCGCSTRALSGRPRRTMTGVFIRSSRAAGSAFISNGTTTFCRRHARCARRQLSYSTRYRASTAPCLHCCRPEESLARTVIHSPAHCVITSDWSPPIRTNAEILVDGVQCVWRDGQAFMFDETFIHSAENATDQTSNHPVLRC